MNFNIRKLEDDIISILNGSEVPIEAKRLILAEILDKVNKEAERVISLEINREEEKNVVRESQLCE